MKETASDREYRLYFGDGRLTAEELVDWFQSNPAAVDSEIQDQFSRLGKSDVVRLRSVMDPNRWQNGESDAAQLRRVVASLFTPLGATIRSILTGEPNET